MVKRNVIVLILYLVLALVMTYPLVSQFGDHVPGTTTWSMDEYGYVWNNWWFKHALFDLGTNPFQTNDIFYPIGTSLVLYTFTLIHVLLGLPFQLLFGLIPASNAELLFAFVMSGYGMFLLVQYLLLAWESRTGREGQDLQISTFAAFIAGAVFAFSSNRFVYASLGHYNVVATEWIPFYILFLVKTVRETGWSNALLGGLFAALALYVETTDGVLLFLFSLVFLIFAWRQSFRRATLARVLVLGMTASILFMPLLIPTLSEIFSSGYSLPGWGHAERLLVDLFGFTTPTSLHPLNRHWVQELSQVRQGNSRFIDVNTVFLGYVTLVLAAVGAVRYWKTLQIWAASAITFAILSLGPLLHINGQSVFDLDNLQVTFPLPFLFLHYIPLLKENRVPNRFSVLVMVSLAVLVGFAVAWVMRGMGSKAPNAIKRIGAFAVGSVLLILILFEHAAMPLPLTDARVPDVYGQIAREPGDFTVLTLPLGWRNSFGQLGAEDTRAQYYQSVSNKFTFAGNIQRNPPFLFDYFDRISLFHSLTELEFYREVPDAVVALDRASAPTLMSFFDVRYVVIQPSIPGRPPYSDTRAAVAEYVRNVLPLGAKIYDRDGVEAFRVNQAPLPSKLEIGFGKPEAHLYQAEGWDRDETLLNDSINWANRQNARVLIPLREVADYQVTLRIVPFLYPQSPMQTMQVLVNGEPIEKFELGRAWGTYSTILPARVLHPGLNDLSLEFAYVARPHDVMPTSFAIGATGATSPVDIVVSAPPPGTESGQAFGSIRVNGHEESLLGRGYNVVIVDPKSSRVVDRRVFNTAEDRSQSRNLTDLIGEIPNGYIVAVASQAQVAASLGDKTVAALRSIGAQVDIRQTPNRSHAIIGVKGSAPGTAVEESSEDTSFISVGHVTDERTLAAAVSEITIEKR